MHLLLIIPLILNTYYSLKLFTYSLYFLLLLPTSNITANLTTPAILTTPSIPTNPNTPTTTTTTNTNSSNTTYINRISNTINTTDITNNAQII